MEHFEKVSLFTDLTRVTASTGSIPFTNYVVKYSAFGLCAKGVEGVREVSSPLYWDRQAARKEALKMVADLDRSTKRMLELLV